MTKNFISQIPGKQLKGMRTAIFDTRVDEKDINSSFLRFMLKSFGYAAGKLAKRAKRRGAKMVMKPEGSITLFF